MQPEAHAVFRARRTDRNASPIIEAGEHVGFAIELDVDDAHVVSRRPEDGLLEAQAPADIDAYTVTQRHLRSLACPGFTAVLPTGEIRRRGRVAACRHRTRRDCR